MTIPRRQFLAGLAATAAAAPFGRWPTVTDDRAEVALPLLTNEQLGHLRHIERLAAMPDGEWALMGAFDPAQEDLSSYRYQLAIMAYAVGLAHYHRLPAAPGVFQPTFERLIHKMLRREVWSYWRETSRSGPRLDPGLTKLRDGWTDPVRLENIMYSGHLHAMVGMYATLFNDDRYAARGALTFRYDPIFYGLGPEVFPYDHESLTRVIFDQMKSGFWHGIPCEPNNVFIVCNQYPILGFRFFDLRRGTDLASEAIAGYRATWGQKGMHDAWDNNISTWMVRQDQKVDAFSGGFSAWSGSAMNVWNPEEVRAQYPKVLAQWTERTRDGRVTLRSPTSVIGARRGMALSQLPAFRWTTPDFGYFGLWVSEMGDQETLRGMFAHADRFMRPTWDNGALYYPRNDRSFDDAGNMTFVEPVTGNAALAYARLNVEDGMRALYQHPWGAPHFAEPAVASVSPALDLLGARYDAPAETLAFAIRGREGHPAPGSVRITNVAPDRPWSLRRAGRVVASHRAPASIVRRVDDALVVTVTSRAHQRFDLSFLPT